MASPQKKMGKHCYCERIEVERNRRCLQVQSPNVTYIVSGDCTAGVPSALAKNGS